MKGWINSHTPNNLVNNNNFSLKSNFVLFFFNIYIKKSKINLFYTVFFPSVKWKFNRIIYGAYAAEAHWCWIQDKWVFIWPVSFVSLYFYFLYQSQNFIFPFVISEFLFRWSMVDLVLLVKPSKGFKLSEEARAFICFKY